MTNQEDFDSKILRYFSTYTPGETSIRREVLPTGQEVYRNIPTGQFTQTDIGHSLPSRNSRREFLDDGRIVYRNMGNGQFVAEDLADVLRRPDHGQNPSGKIEAICTFHGKAEGYVTLTMEIKGDYEGFVAKDQGYKLGQTLQVAKDWVPVDLVRKVKTKHS